MGNNNYNAWITTAMEHGMSAYEAGLHPNAKAAHEQDRADEKQAMQSASKTDFIETFLTNRITSGVKTMGWQDQEEFLAAISAPEYETSKAYRDACAEITNKTDASVIGVSAVAKSADGTLMKMGRTVTEPVTKHSMLENAYREYVIEAMGQFDESTAKGRYEKLAFMADPKNAEAIAYAEGLVTSDEQRTNNVMLESKASGRIQRYVTPVEGAIDVPEGVTVYANRDNEQGKGEQS